MKSYAFLVGFFACLGACSAKDQSPDPYATVSEFCGAWGKAACNSMVVSNCSGSSTTTTLTDQCVQSQQTFCEGIVPNTGYSSAQATRCLDAVGAAYADAKLSATDIATVRHLGDPCNHLIKGPKAVGDSCTVDTDCDTVKNVQCVLKKGVGTCVVPMLVGPGTSCAAPGAACGVDFYCDGSHCVQSTAVGDPCASDFECASGLSCDAATGNCATRVNPAMCMADGDCTTGVCDIVGTAPNGACVDSIILAHAEGICGDLR
jgi:hypothetical protein